MKNKYIDDLCDELDAAVFTGDTFLDTDERRQFRNLLDRWSRQMTSYDDIDESG